MINIIFFMLVDVYCGRNIFEVGIGFCFPLFACHRVFVPTLHVNGLWHQPLVGILSVAVEGLAHYILLLVIQGRADAYAQVYVKDVHCGVVICLATLSYIASGFAIARPYACHSVS